MPNNIVQKIRYKINSTIKSKVLGRKQELLRKNILDYYRNNPTENIEIKQAVDYLSKHKLSNFYGNFQDKYNYKGINVLLDNENGLPYVLVDGKRLYFKRSQNRRTVQLMFNGLRIEQDKDAPHCYTDEEFYVKPDDVLADIGCAEAYFSLLNIEKLKKLYLFEQDKGWIEALRATFRPWKENVEIVQKYVSDRNSETEIRLDDFFRDKSPLPNFYKIDVEGAESSVLSGMKEILRTKPLKVALCTYHHAEDFDLFLQFFNENGFEHRANPGVMIFQNDIDIMQPPYFRKCLIKAERK
ncbi:MAG: FkbM family methyltransferase [Bacteroidia bacterium]|nr:FkbM family methyltransferase [Bacteroidia bacterium]